MKKHFVLFQLFLIFSVSSAFSQAIPNEFIVEYGGRNFNHFIDEIKTANTSRFSAEIEWKKLTVNFDYFLIKVDVSESTYWKNSLQKHPDILNLQQNATLEKRLKPNDPRLAEQWHLETIKAYDAWEVTTGGTDFGGREIVIAILDDGFDVDHEDMKNVYWKNEHEIPNDGIDNDNNGFVDDYHGWNTIFFNDNISMESHGTNVSGIASAVGDNEIGISGINWNVKVLPIVIKSSVSEIIAAYDYIYTQRKLFNDTNGEKGAYIVVANYSGGIPKVFAENYTMWCGWYDKLGYQGILSVGSTANDDVDVDKVGDMPSTCTSNFLIIVTNTNRRDKKERYAGYGAKSVDIGVPGEKILTTDTAIKGKYRLESGTSLSAPILSGTIGLLYSLKCEPFYESTLIFPGEAALKIKKAVLNSADPISDLKTTSTSGGRLNIYNAMDSVRVFYDNCINLPSPKGLLAIEKLTKINNILKIDYRSPNENPIEILIYDTSGRVIKRETVIPPLLGPKNYFITFDLEDIYGISRDLTEVFFVSMILGRSKVSKSFFFFNH